MRCYLICFASISWRSAITVVLINVINLVEFGRWKFHELIQEFFNKFCQAQFIEIYRLRFLVILVLLFRIPDIEEILIFFDLERRWFGFLKDTVEHLYSKLCLLGKLIDTTLEYDRLDTVLIAVKLSTAQVASSTGICSLNATNILDSIRITLNVILLVEILKQLQHVYSALNIEVLDDLATSVYRHFFCMLAGYLFKAHQSIG